MITGMTRKSFFISKILSLIVLSIFATLIYYFSTILIGILHTDGYDMDLMFDNNYAGLRFFLSCIGTLSIAFLIAIVIRKGTLAILFYFLYTFILELVFRLIQFQYFPNRMQTYWPQNSIEDLMPFPGHKLTDSFVNHEWNFVSLLPYSHAAGMTIVYTIIFLGLAYYSFMKRDV